MRGLSPERWRRLDAILDEVLELPPGTRGARLDVLCADDPELRDEAEALLDADAVGRSLLEAPAADYLAEAATGGFALGADDIAAGTTIGAYRVLRELARGGMGSVHLAERADGHFQQRVALKLIRRGMDSDEIIRRFLGERQILASLQHPGIARLLDGGVSETGQPFFAMEHVEGEPLTTYCDTHALGVDARLRLFLTVCDAVRYAHRNLVVHRDLKPSNILVTPDGRAVLLDFGIAKVLRDDAAAADSMTQVGPRVLTPEYAAPEQLTGAPVTTATDVYALGAILYEMLTGHRAHPFVERSPLELERVIVREDPPPPSAAVTRGTDGVAPDQLAASRSTDPTRLRRRLRGDLDTVVLRAMHKEPDRRYATVDALADDLERHLAGLAVSAHRDSIGYRTRKFVRRHRVGVAATAVVGTSLVAGMVGTLWQARVARAEAAKAEAVGDFLVSVFEAAGPEQARGRELTARDLLELGTARLDSATFGEQPLVRAEILSVLAGIHRDLGLYVRADSLFERVERIQRDAWGDADARLAATLRDRARVLIELGELERAELLLQDALSVHRRHLAPDDPLLAVTLNEAAGLHRRRGEYAAAESFYAEALAIDRAHYGADHQEVAKDLGNLAVTVSEAGDVQRAADLQRQALAIRRARLAAPHPDLATTIANLAADLRVLGAYEEAEALAREALDMRRTLLGDAHPDLAYSLNGLALVLDAQGRLDEAAPLFREALRVRREGLGADHPEYVASVNNFGIFSYRAGDLEAATEAFREALERWSVSLGSEHPSTMTARNNLGVALLDRGALSEAEPLLVRALEERRRVRGERHLEVGMTLRALGVLRHRQGRIADADRALGEAVSILRERLPAGHPRIADPLVALGGVRVDAGRLDEAESVLREALALREVGLGDEHVQTAIARRELGACLARLGRFAEAEALLLAARRVIAANPYARHELEPTERSLERLYARSGRAPTSSD